MRVCFINPPVQPYRKIMRNFDCATESKGNYLYQPYDFLLMSSKIPKSWNLKFIDAIANCENFENINEQLVSFNPQVIVCAIAATNKTQDFDFLKNLKNMFSESYLFVFGDLFIDDSAVKEVESLVDGIFTSPVMFDFEILSKIETKSDFTASYHNGLRNNQFYKRSDLKNPNQIKLRDVRHDLFKHPAYRWPFSTRFNYTTIFTAWGCPYSCSYCILNKFPNYWRHYEEILDEMDYVKQLGIKEIYIGDRSFGLPLKNILSLLRGMIERKFNFTWSTYFHPNQYTPELLDLMKKAGCRTIIVGIESKNIKSLKKFGRHVREDQFSSLIEHAKKINIEVCGDFIIGLPDESEEDINQTIQYSIDLEIDYASFNIATPLAGSSFRSMAIEAGKIEANEGEIDSLGKNKVISLSNVSSQQLIRLRNKAVIRFYLRPIYLLKRVLNISSIEHFYIQAMEALLLIRKSF